MKTATIFFALLCLLGAAVGQDVRYMDDINGFSLIPPDGAIQTKVDEASVLAQWIKVDPKTSNTEWAFSVSRWVADVRDPKGDKLKDSDYAALKIASFADSILADMQSQPSLKVLDRQETTICDRPAMVLECSGLVAANLPNKEMLESPENKRWMKQAWVRVTPRMFLTFKIVGREKFKRQARTAWGLIMDTLKITDDKAGSVRQKEKAVNAEKFLKQIAGEKLQGVFKRDAEWFLISQDSKNIGWLCMGAKPKIAIETSGYELRSYAAIQPAGQPLKLIYQQMFVSDDLKTEQWRLWMQAGDGSNVQLMAEDGLVQDYRVLCETNSSAQPGNKQLFDLPDVADRMYLPKALGMVLASQLIKTDTSGYIFAEYDSSRNNLAMREIMVVGPEEIATDTGPAKSIKIIEKTDRANQPTTYWISPDGKILKIQNPAGMVMAATSREMVLKYFPNAPAMIDAIRKASQKKWKEGNR